MSSKNGYLLFEFLLTIGLIGLFFPIVLVTSTSIHRHIQNTIKTCICLSELRYLHSQLSLECLKTKTLIATPQLITGKLISGETFKLQITTKQFRLAHNNGSYQALTEELPFSQALFKLESNNILKLTLISPALCSQNIILFFPLYNLQ